MSEASTKPTALGFCVRGGSESEDNRTPEERCMRYASGERKSGWDQTPGERVPFDIQVD